MKRRHALVSAAAGLLGTGAASASAGRPTPRPPGDAAPLRIAMVLFPRLTQLDFTGPYEVLARLPDVEVQVVAQTLDPVMSDTGLRLLPTHTFDTAGAPDVLFVPGGPGQTAQMTNPALIGFLVRAAADAAWVTSVCTGSLLLGAAGLLDGYRATCHWMSIDQLAMFGAVVDPQRTVVDRNRVTGGGVTSGIDFAFVLAAQLRGEPVARRIELVLEYDPHPPFASGTPRLAGPALVDEVRGAAAQMLADRRAQSVLAAARLRQPPASAIRPVAGGGGQ